MIQGEKKNNIQTKHIHSIFYSKLISNIRSFIRTSICVLTVVKQPRNEISFAKLMTFLFVFVNLPTRRRSTEYKTTTKKYVKWWWKNRKVKTQKNLITDMKILKIKKKPIMCILSIYKTQNLNVVLMLHSLWRIHDTDETKNYNCTMNECVI